MRLTDHTDYSLRVLMYLNRTKKLATLRELSTQLGISRNNLIKVSNQLVKFELIESTRGPSGGIFIREGVGQIDLSSIIQKTEESFQMADCFGKEKSSCTMQKSCRLKASLYQALQAFLKSLEGTTLDDITH